MAALIAGCVVTAGTASAQDAAPMTVEASDLLEWNQNAGTYTAIGNAVAAQGAAEIKGDKLVATYDPESPARRIDELVATGNVSYKNETSTATGSKLVYDIASETYLVEGKNAKVTGPNGTMTATKTIRYDGTDTAEQTVVANGAAVYIDADGRSVAGDQIIAILGADGALKTLDAETNVKVVSINGQIATGDSVAYDFATSKALLTGNVEIIDGPSVMRGDRAEVDFDSGISRILSDGSGKRVSGVLNP